MGIGTSWKAVLLLGVGAAGGAAAVAVATVPDSSGVIHACLATDRAGLPVPTTNVRIIDPASGQSCSPPAGAAPTETALSWNVTGPPGPPGQNGAPGAQGPPGASGKTATVTAGNTFRIGGTVVTVGQSRGLTLASPPFTGRAIATLTLSGGLSLTTDISGISFAPHATGSGAGAGAGKAAFHDIQITKKLDKASPKLIQACATGTHIKDAVITLRKAGGSQIEYALHDVLVASYASGSAGAGAKLPSESLTLNFGSIQIHYTKQK